VVDPSKRFITLVLALGIAVLVAAIAFGERAGDKVIGQVTEKRLDSIAPVTLTPAPVQKSASPYGPNWKRTEVMSAATDPAFPDPRVPPVPPPTLPPPPKHTPTPLPSVATPTPMPNLNIPIWRREAPLPTPTPTGSETPYPGPSDSPSPSPQP
jgi:hypothetical protein